MRLLVFGATGQTGQELIRQALEHRHSVTAFVRHPGKLAIAEPAIRVIQGNVRDFATVAAAVPEHDAVVSALGVGTPLQHDPDVIAGVGHIIRAMQEHRVLRLIYLSFIGVRESRSAVGFVLRYVAPIPLRHEIADHEVKEELIRGSRLDWTIVRPPKLTNGSLTGRYRSRENITTWKPLPLLSRADLAHFILQELAEPRYIGRAPRLLH
jgi:putative NADH-flavin reductase